MPITDDILAARRAAAVRCGLSSLTAPSIAELAREFGLWDDEEAYEEVDEATAKLTICLLLHLDMAYESEMMPLSRAEQLTEEFFAQFGVGSRFYTNNDVSSATEATFDKGILISGPDRSGCLWVEDED